MVEATETDVRRWGIRHATRATNSRCPLTGEWLNDTASGWVLCADGGRVSADVAADAPAILREIVAALNAASVPIGEREHGIAHLATAESSRCLIDWMDDSAVCRPEGNAVWGIAQTRAGGYASRFLAARAAWRITPTLATVLHQHSQLPERPAEPVKAAPIPPPPPTVEAQKRDILFVVAQALANTHSPNVGELKRAQTIADSIVRYARLCQ